MQWYCFERLTNGTRAYLGKVFTSAEQIAEESAREGWMYCAQGNLITIYGIQRAPRRSKKGC